MPFTLCLNSHRVGTFVNREDGRRVIYDQGYGFGYASDSDDYKVVQIVQLFKPDLKSLNSHLVSYGVRSNSSVDVEFPYLLLRSRQTGVFVSGAIHWTVGQYEDDDDPRTDEPGIVIIGFDLELNKLREVPQPEYHNWDDFESKLGELEKCLCQFTYYKDRYMDVWMMKEYGVKESWSILFKVRHPELCYKDWMVPLGFSVTGQEVLMELDGKRLVWYDLKDPNKVKAVEEVTIDGLDGKMDSVVLCHGSLVSPFGAKLPPPKEEVKKVDKQQQKPQPQRKKRDGDFLASGFKLKL